MASIRKIKLKTVGHSNVSESPRVGSIDSNKDTIFAVQTEQGSNRVLLYVTDANGKVTELSYAKSDLSNIDLEVLKEKLKGGSTGIRITQDTLNKLSTTNAFFIIDSELNLDNNAYEIGNNSVVNFTNKGKFINGTLIGKNNQILNPSNELIFKNIKIRGIWNIDKASSSWVFTNKDGKDYDYELLENQYGDRSLVVKLEEENYYSNKVKKAFGVKLVSSPKDDTDNLQQLLNLKAKTTIIEEGIYHIDPSKSEDKEGDFGGLLLKDHKGTKLVLKGSLKVIPSNNDKGSVLRVEDCYKVTIEGSGTVLGSTLEDSNSEKEIQGIRIVSSSYITLKDLSVRLMNGNGIVSTLSTRSESNKLSNISIEGVFLIENRCSSILLEYGTYITINNSKIEYTGRVRGLDKSNGITIQPIDSEDHNLVSGVTIDGNTFIKNIHEGINSHNGVELRIINNSFDNNETDIKLHKTYGNTTTKYFSSITLIENNSSRSFKTFLESYESHSRVDVINNYLEGHLFLKGSYQNSRFSNNTFLYLDQYLTGESMIHCKILNEEIIHARRDSESKDIGILPMILLDNNSKRSNYKYRTEGLEIIGFRCKSKVGNDYIPLTKPNTDEGVPYSIIRTNFFVIKGLVLSVLLKDIDVNRDRFILANLYECDGPLTYINYVSTDEYLLFKGDTITSGTSTAVVTESGTQGNRDYITYRRWTLEEIFPPNTIYKKGETLYYTLKGGRCHLTKDDRIKDELECDISVNRPAVIKKVGSSGTSSSGVLTTGKVTTEIKTQHIVGVDVGKKFPADTIGEVLEFVGINNPANAGDVYTTTYYLNKGTEYHMTIKDDRSLNIVNLFKYVKKEERSNEAKWIVNIVDKHPCNHYIVRKGIREGAGIEALNGRIRPENLGTELVFNGVKTVGSIKEPNTDLRLVPTVSYNHESHEPAESSVGSIVYMYHLGNRNFEILANDYKLIVANSNGSDYYNSSTIVKLLKFQLLPNKVISLSVEASFNRS